MEKDTGLTEVTGLVFKAPFITYPQPAIDKSFKFLSLSILICKMGLMEDFICKVGIKEIKRDDVGTLCPK